MGMCQQECMNGREISNRNSRSADSWKETTESSAKMRVGEQTNTCELEQERRMAYVGDAKLR